ncbi:MAG: MBL fold metallo-hydrolase [Oscillospiraceae bacterium]|nr:MBL fold metallo-hydrolase [Oscillospiraceae bacterium]
MAAVERIKCGNGNCYIISDCGNAVLVDTSLEKYRERILSACKPYKMRLLVLTHGHIDHVQNAAFLARELNIPIAMHKADVDLIADNNAQKLYANTILGKIVLKVSVDSTFKEPFPPFTPDIFLSEGDTLEEYGIPAEVLSLPGHTDGSIALDIDRRALIVGDALMNMFYPTVSMLYHNRTEMLKSAERISSLGDRLIYFGHGSPIKNKRWTR